MANDLAAAKRTTMQHFVLRAGNAISSYRDVCTVLTDDTPHMDRSVSSAGGLFTAQHATNDPTPVDIDSWKSTTSSVAYEQERVVTHKDARDIPNLLMKEAEEMADDAAASISYLFWTVFSSLDSTAHPGRSGSGGPYGASDMFADSFSAPVSQANLITLVLGASTLADAVAYLLKYKRPNGLPLGLELVRENVCLVTTNDQRKLGEDITKRMNEIYGGAGIDPSGQPGMKHAVDPFNTGNYWAIVYRPLSPVKLWIRQKPYLEFLPQNRPGRHVLYSQLEAQAVLEPVEQGVIFSTGAG